MAAPVIEATNTSSTNTAGTSHVVALPAGIVAGDLILVCMAIGSTSATINAHADYAELLDESSAIGLKILYRFAAGGETNPTFVSSANTRDATVTFRVSGAANPAVQAPEIGSTATASSTAPNPPSLDPAGGSKDFLFIAMCGSAGEQADNGTYATAFPTNYGLTNLMKTCGTAGTNLGGMVAVAARQLTTAGPEDPGTFTVSENNTWRAQTIAIHPAVPTTTAVAEVSLAGGSEPTSRTQHSLHVRARTTAPAGKMRLALYEGASNITDTSPGYLETTALSTSLADYSLSVADADAAAIGSYADLGVRFWGYAANGGSIVFEVDQIWLETPGSSAPPVYVPRMGFVNHSEPGVV